MFRQKFDLSELSLADLDVCETALRDAESAMSALAPSRRAALHADVAELKAIRRAIEAHRRSLITKLSPQPRSALPRL